MQNQETETKTVETLLLHPNALRVHAAASKDDPRYSICGIRVEPDGSTVATNGHILFKYTPEQYGTPEEYPAVFGAPCERKINTSLEPFVLPTEACKNILKASVPKSRQALPCCDYLALNVPETNKNGQAVLAHSDLENVQTFKPEKAEGQFPNYQNVIPDEAPMLEVGVNVDYLLEVARTIKAMSNKGCRERNAVRLRFFPDKGSSKTAERPIEFRAIVDNGKTVGEFYAIVMPMILK